MRKTLITSAAVASVLALGVAAGVGQAGGPDPATTPDSTIPGGDLFGDAGLTTEQTECLMQSIADVDIADTGAIMDLVSECGIDIGALTGILGSTPEDAETGAPTTELGGVETVPSDELDPGAAAAVLALLGIDASAAQCIADGLGAADVLAGDDDVALTVLHECGVSLTDLLVGLASLHDLAGGVITDDTSVTADTATDTSTQGIASDNPMVQQMQEMLAQQGIELDAEQASCLLDNVADLDLNDMSAMMTVMESCGISLTDLAPQG